MPKVKGKAKWLILVAALLGASALPQQAVPVLASLLDVLEATQDRPSGL